MTAIDLSLAFLMYQVYSTRLFFLNSKYLASSRGTSAPFAEVKVLSGSSYLATLTAFPVGSTPL